MLNNLIKLIKKNPREAVVILLIPLILYAGAHQPPNQSQGQAQVNNPTDYVDEPFDRNQCKVYNLGLALGAWAFQFKGTDGKLNYILFTDNQEVVQTFDKTNLGILWWPSSGFRGYNYTELAKVLPPEGLKELAASLNNYSFAAIGTPAFAKAVQESQNAGLLNTCDVD